MGLFSNKNPNESKYPDGKKNITNVIKNEGHGNLLLWRHPYEDFNNNSTLIVMPGEQAIFVDGGNIAEVFTEGTYKLSTNNYPFIGRLRNYFSGGVSVFNCVVYYFRTAVTSQIYWGTKSPIKVRDPIFGIMCDMTARGSYKVLINDPAKFLKKLGGNVPFKSQKQLEDYFGSEIIMHINSNLARAIQESNQELITISAKQDIIAVSLREIINNIISDFGLEISSFAFEAINIVDNDTRKMLEDAIAKRGVMGIMGANWEAQKKYELLDKVADNPSSMPGVAAGLGMGFATGNVFAGMMNSTYGMPQNQMMDFAQTQVIPNPLDKLNNNQPAQQPPQYANPGYPQQPMQQMPPQQYQGGFQQVQQPQTPPAPTAGNNAAPQQDPIAAMQSLKQALEAGFITQEQYTQKINEILSRM